MQYSTEKMQHYKCSTVQRECSIINAVQYRENAGFLVAAAHKLRAILREKHL